MTIARFCSECGAPLPAPPPVRCDRCGVDHWRNAKPCANALVVRCGTILLVRRAHAPWRDTWCAPGGFCEEDEHPVAAAEREILEEAGVRARVTGFIGIWVCRYAEDPSDDTADAISVAYYFAVPLDGDARTFDRRETLEAAWFAIGDVPDELAPPGVLEEILAAARPAVESSSVETPLADVRRLL